MRETTKDLLAFGLLFSIAIAGIGALVAMGMHSLGADEKAPCDAFSNRSINDMPARCLKEYR